MLQPKPRFDALPIFLRPDRILQLRSFGAQTTLIKRVLISQCADDAPRALPRIQKELHHIGTELVRGFHFSHSPEKFHDDSMHGVAMHGHMHPYEEHQIPFFWGNQLIRMMVRFVRTCALRSRILGPEHATNSTAYSQITDRVQNYCADIFRSTTYWSYQRDPISSSGVYGGKQQRRSLVSNIHILLFRSHIRNFDDSGTSRPGHSVPYCYRASDLKPECPVPSPAQRNPGPTIQ